MWSEEKPDQDSFTQNVYISYKCDSFYVRQFTALENNVYTVDSILRPFTRTFDLLFFC